MGTVYLADDVEHQRKVVERRGKTMRPTSERRLGLAFMWEDAVLQPPGQSRGAPVIS